MRRHISIGSFATIIGYPNAPNLDVSQDRVQRRSFVNTAKNAETKSSNLQLGDYQLTKERRTGCGKFRDSSGYSLANINCLRNGVLGAENSATVP